MTVPMEAVGAVVKVGVAAREVDLEVNLGRVAWLLFDCDCEDNVRREPSVTRLL